MGKTEIFESYEEFCKREDKSVNGVSRGFSKEHPAFSLMNGTNKACWDCYDCNDCIGCNHCNDCYALLECTDCSFITDRSDCYALHGDVIENKDKINPDHYKVGNIESIAFMESRLSKEELIGAMKFNILKYIGRANLKGQHDDDIKKSQWYMDKLVELLDQ